MYLYIYTYKSRWDRAYFKNNVAKTEDEVKAEKKAKKLVKHEKNEEYLKSVPKQDESTNM
jgi:hypothetical protein